jgi:putative tryptophan/tyrosine transport system substrate-binding protein
MNRRTAIRRLATFFLTTASFAEAQQTGKVPRVGFLLGSSPGPDPRVEAFRQGLRDLGYVEGKNIVIEWRFAEGKQDRLPELAAELVHLNVEIIVTDGTAVTRAAKNATKTIPIVMAADGDPIGNGFVASLAHPGGNITGLSNLISDLSGKRLEILKEAFPGISRIGVIWNPENPSSATGFKETQAAAKALALQLQSLEVRSPSDFEGAFQAASKRQARALSVLSDSLMFNNRKRLLDIAVKHRLPTMHTQSLWADAGALMSYGTNLPDLYRRAATYVDKILKGAKPADIPVEQPMRFEFVVNLKTAKQIGVTIDPNVLVRAQRVIR